MAEELKQEEKKAQGNKMMSAIFKVILGLAFLVIAVYLLIGRGWWKDTWFVIRGCAGPFLILAAIITLAIAKE